MFEDKDIHDIFEHANVENEDWLQPSDKIFPNIEAAIYSKKRDRWLWVLLPFIFLIGGTLTYFYLNESTEETIITHQQSTANLNSKKQHQDDLSVNKDFSNITRSNQSNEIQKNSRTILNKQATKLEKDNQSLLSKDLAKKINEPNTTPF